MKQFIKAKNKDGTRQVVPQRRRHFIWSQIRKLLDDVRFTEKLTTLKNSGVSVVRGILGNDMNEL